MSTTSVHSSSSLGTIVPNGSNSVLASFQSVSSARALDGNSSAQFASSITDHAAHLNDQPQFVDLQFSPYTSHSIAPPENEQQMADSNPLPDLIPDEVYQLLRTNDLISEKGVRDYIIRRAFKAMRQEQYMKSSEALERLQNIYPYLQIDTIRKIIYRIGPAANRKMMY